MNNDPTSPDDIDRDLSISAIEQRLKQLQPRPANVDLESLMTIAREQSVPTPLRHSDTRHPPVPRTAVLPLLTAGLGGAFLGVALTCLFFLTTVPFTSNASNLTQVAGPTSARPNDGRSEVDRETATPARSPSSASTIRDTYRGESGSSDWLISNSVVEGGMFRNYRPLAAGNQLPISRRTDPRGTARSVTVRVKSPTVTSPPTPAIDRNSPTTYSRDTDKLLKEILGTRPDSSL